MYLSAERLALANRKVKETFEQTSVAWQAIPHWETGDPSRTEVPDDKLTKRDFVDLKPKTVEVFVTLAEAISPMPDAVLAKVIAGTVALAAEVDNAVFPALAAATEEKIPTTPKFEDLLNALIEARAAVEKHGYRAPSCLLTNTDGLKLLSGLINNFPNPGTAVLLPAANINSLHRVEKLVPDEESKADSDEESKADSPVWGWLLGRRRRIAHGGAAEASPGEEAVDLAVSIPPSLEVVGEKDNTIKLLVRISYATRVKDEGGLVLLRLDGTAGAAATTKPARAPRTGAAATTTRASGTTRKK